MSPVQFAIPVDQQFRRLPGIVGALNLCFLLPAVSRIGWQLDRGIGAAGRVGGPALGGAAVEFCRIEANPAFPLLSARLGGGDSSFFSKVASVARPFDWRNVCRPAFSAGPMFGLPMAFCAKASMCARASKFSWEGAAR